MARCGPTFVPVLPNWNLTVQIYKWNGSIRVRELPDITAQVQAQDQSASEGQRATAYLRHRKEDDRLRDPWDYGDGSNPNATDAVSFLLPSGRRVYYLVREVQGKNLGFPNAHLQSTLAKAHYAEIPAPPPDEPPPPLEFHCANSFMVVDTNTAPADGETPITVTYHLRDQFNEPMEGYTVRFYHEFGGFSPNVGSAVTDENGMASVEVTWAEEGNGILWGVVAGLCWFTRAVTWGEGGDPGDEWELLISGMSDEGCGDPTPLETPNHYFGGINDPIDSSPPFYWKVADLPGTCITGPWANVNLKWHIEPNLAILDFEQATSEFMARYTADYSEWDHLTEPLVFTLGDFALDQFGWPATITFQRVGI